MTRDEFNALDNSQKWDFAQNAIVARDAAIAAEAKAVADLQAANTKHTEDLAAKDAAHQTATDALTAQHATAMAAKDAEKQAALDAAEAKRVADIASLQAQVATLSQQLTGSVGARQIATSNLIEAALALESPDWLQTNVYAMLVTLVQKHKLALFTGAMQAFPGLSAEVRGQLLGALGMPEFVPLDVPGQVKALQIGGLAAFEQLEALAQQAIFGMIVGN